MRSAQLREATNRLDSKRGSILGWQRVSGQVSNKFLTSLLNIFIRESCMIIDLRDVFYASVTYELIDQDNVAAH